MTALSLSPVMDMLATTHVNRRGIYLWSNAAIYGSGADVRPSELPVDARLPALASGGPPPPYECCAAPIETHLYVQVPYAANIRPDNADVECACDVS